MNNYIRQQHSSLQEEEGDINARIVGGIMVLGLICLLIVKIYKAKNNKNKKTKIIKKPIS
jgi:hypothetical protein